MNWRGLAYELIREATTFRDRFAQNLSFLKGEGVLGKDNGPAPPSRGSGAFVGRTSEPRDLLHAASLRAGASFDPAVRNTWRLTSSRVVLPSRTR